MTVGVVVFPGSNCDLDALYAIAVALKEKAIPLWHQQEILPKVDAILLPGGFSYGDYLRPGAIASRSPIMKAIKEFANKGGLVIGICNGFQVLLEAQLLPGVLLRNTSTRFISRSLSLKIENNTTPFTVCFQHEQLISLPVAHKDGNYFAEATLLEQLKKNRQIVVSYCDNPNGSTDSIAGICNEKGNVFGLMPHPERACTAWSDSREGLLFFESMRSFLEERR